MSNEMLQKTIDLVSSLEVKTETQQIAKYELIEYTERLHKENQKLKEKLKASEKARKEAIELINNINDWEICSKYDCMYKDDVLDVLRMLDIDKGE